MQEQEKFWNLTQNGMTSDSVSALPKEFCERMQQFLGEDAERFFDSYQKERVYGLRYNSLKFSSKEAAARVEKLLRSAIANWEQKNERKAESGELFVTKIFVDGGATLKRMRPAPQGRGYRIRKRSNHVTLFVGAKSNNEDQN